MARNGRNGKDHGNGKKNLVIVESPTKARTVAGILGSEYEVRASIGHVRDLPKSQLGVDVERQFAPRYVVPKEKREIVKQLRDAARNARMVYLATDPDREGEAISWHLVQAAELEGVPHRRVVFHEITRDAIREAFRHPREIDVKLVDAQQARRVLDRLVGYKISPILWKKVRRGLSAGRVQSAALRMIVDREREIQGFVPQEYWTIEADLAKAAEVFRARLHAELGKKGTLEIPSAEEAQALVSALRTARYRVAEVRRRDQTRRPAPPFTTSTLQQEASRRLGFSAKRTMTVAQQLYEGRPLGSEGAVGLITYMRTDSTALSDVAKQEIRAYVTERFGADFVPAKPRVYTKKAKGAQEAHEAIRPTSVYREPDAIKRHLTPDQYKLYSLIWQRAVASQMADAVFDTTSVDIEARPPQGRAFLFRATDSRLRFPGFRQVYIEARDDGRDEDQDTPKLPDLQPGDDLDLRELYPEQHFTEPPPRYTEASLVKALEENGIGRPSTYAPILSTLQERGYVEKDGRVLKPLELGFVVNDLLVEHFPDVVDLGFTAEMEEDLDAIARGARPWVPVVQEFYEPLTRALSRAQEAPAVQEETGETCEKCGKPMVIKWGRFGRFLACTGFPECRNTRPLEGREEERREEAADEPCPECGAAMVVRSGRYGKFLACSRYPECKGTRPLLQKTGARCPKCGGDVVQRRSRRGRTFYGCATYPACDFTSWSRPLEEPCPSCGGLLVAAGRGNRARCTACDWSGQPGKEKELTAASGGPAS
ncbi:MAG TPA: type I DNA topoisomerase [Dehalococcoidia bacterium]